MASLTLVHPEETVTVPIFQARTKCSLFQTNPALLTGLVSLGFPGVCLHIGKEDGQDYFSEFTGKLFRPSKDSTKQQLRSPLAGVRSALLSESREFLANGAVIDHSIAESAALFPAVRKQLSVYGCR
jgi:hypothetical protein